MRQFAIIMFFGLINIGIVMAQTFGGSIPRTDGMAVYKNYGLVYNIEKRAYCFNDKIVGLFVDEQSGKFNRLSAPDVSEIHIKVNREPDGKIISITELTPTEYAKLMEAFDAWRIAMANQMKEWGEQFRANIHRIPPPIIPSFPLGAFDAWRNALDNKMTEWGNQFRANIQRIPPPIIPSFPWPSE